MAKTSIYLNFQGNAEEADRIYNTLSQGGTESVAPHDEFCGYWGVCLDRFGIRWMFNVPKQL
jgi:PhnB protein